MSDWKNVQYKDGKMRTSEGGGGGGSSTFAGLDDVSFSDLQNGQVPKYNSTTQKWENANESGGGGTVTDVEVDGVSVVNQQGVAEITMPTPPSVPDELSDLSDVQFSNLTDHQPLRYNATSQKWENGADSFPPLIYSDEEREVGVWRDGKPLYQKNFWLSSRTSIKNDYTTILDSDTTAHNIENIVSGCVYDNNGGADLKRVRLLTGDISLIVSNNNQLIAWTSTNNIYATTGYILQYTKTTDTPGSGTWTTQGGYAHHYSTNEKVIGTWIDGKPLYEKVVEKTCSFTTRSDISSVIYSGEISVSSEISNIDMAWFIKDKSYYIVSGNSTREFINGWYEKDNGIFYIQTLYSRSNVACKFVIQYTKTTDV